MSDAFCCFSDNYELNGIWHSLSFSFSLSLLRWNVTFSEKPLKFWIIVLLTTKSVNVVLYAIIALQSNMIIRRCAVFSNIILSRNSSDFWTTSVKSRNAIRIDFLITTVLLGIRVSCSFLASICHVTSPLCKFL